MTTPGGIQLLVCDLDDTLYDWVHYFVTSFYAMVEKVVEITGADREVLLDDFRHVHIAHHDSEHPFSLLETRYVRERFANLSRAELYRKLDPAFHAFNSHRLQTLKLHEGVRDGLEVLHRSNIRLVAHTESKLFGVADRLGRLGLAPYFSRIYCRERPATVHPVEEIGRTWLSQFALGSVIELPRHQRKPDAAILRELCAAEGVSPQQSAYVGDSLARDMLMAKEAGLFAIWAKYGCVQSAHDYASLVRISHWTDEDIRRESDARERARVIEPDVIAETSFAEVVDAVLARRTHTAVKLAR
jgi:FMN phosphatase YigB (HAD superfamily)